MKYYKDTNGQVFAYEDDGSQDAYIKPDLVPMTPEEVEARINPKPTQEELQRTRLAANNSTYNTVTMTVTGDYPQFEKDTWPTQDEQARAWASDHVANTPWIDRAAAERGIPREEYMRRTLVKSEQFKVMSSFLTGRRQKYEDEIKGGADPVLDYALTPEIMMELQQIAIDIMSATTEQLQGVAT